jgi:Cu/Ag efflux pump CusA
VTPRTTSSLLWGLVGALAFLVLVQGYDLVAGLSVGFVARFAVAVLVGVVAAALSYRLAPRLRSKGRT